MATQIKMTPILKDESSVRFNRELANSKPDHSSKERIDELVLKVLDKQRNLLEEIKSHCLTKLNMDKKINSYRDSVWLLPNSGMFLYFDVFVEYKIVIKMIEDKTLIYCGMALHQGEKMHRYQINKEILKQIQTDYDEKK